jgi:hypothetical protein
MDLLFNDTVNTRLASLATSLAAGYQTAEPCPNFVVDDFLPEAVLRDLLAVFPKPRTITHLEFDDELQVKLAYNRVDVLPPVIRSLLFYLNSPPVLQFLESATGITGLIPDPYLTGGGLHQIEPGGKLDIHADFNRLERLKLDRRLNLLLYLNSDWKEEYGGHLELWDRSMTKCVKKILPVFNRCVVFSTTDHAYHGHPLPLTCPRGMTRKSMALYYYTNGRPVEEATSAHSTLFQRRPGQPVNGSSGRLQRVAKRTARALLPPLVVDAYSSIRQRWARG